MVHKLTSVILMGLLLQACSGNSSSTRTLTTPESESVITGRVGNAISGSRISATTIDLEGSPTRTENSQGDIVFEGAAAQTEASGNYELTIESEEIGTAKIFISNDDNGPVTFRCEDPSGCGKNSYLDYVEFSGGLDIRAGVGEVAADMVVNVNWVTDLAASLARTVYIDAVTNGISADDRQDISQAVLDDVDKARTGVYNEYTMELANLHVSKLFNVSDIIYVTPVGPSQIAQVTSVRGQALTEGIYYGAIVAALSSLPQSTKYDYMTVLSLITEDLREQKGQILQKSSDEDSTETITLYRLLTTAAGLLQRNIDHLEAQRVQVPDEAKVAMDRLNSYAAALKEGVQTNVKVDVPEELANWSSNIEKAKEFIVDLTEAVKNFWGTDTDKSSFVNSEHARRMDAYYEAHERIYGQVISKSFFGNADQNGVVDEIMVGIEALITCQFGEGDCSMGSTLLIEGGDSDNDGYESNTVVIDKDNTDKLMVSMRPVGSRGENGYTQFDFVFDTSLNSLARNGVTYEWEENTISDGSLRTAPYIRLLYDIEYDSPPPLNVDKNSGLTNPSPVDPAQISIVWPSVNFEANIPGAGIDSGSHELTVLFEANLVGVQDPVDASSPVRYNPFTVVLWLRSLKAAVAGDTNNIGNTSSITSQIRASNATAFYPETRWPAFDQFFNERTDAPVTIPNMIRSLYQGTEVLSAGTVVDVFDTEIIGDDFIRRIRIYPYDSSSNTTESQTCTVSLDRSEVIGCSSALVLSGNVEMDDLIANYYETDALTDYLIPANGTYRIDLSSTDIVDSNGNFRGLTEGVVYGKPSGVDCELPSPDPQCGFEGAYIEPVELGIERLAITINSYLNDSQGGQVPTQAEFSLTRKVEDIFSATVAYSFGEEENYEAISDAIGVGVGSEAQAFYLQYDVTEDSFRNNEGESEVIEVELGAWIVYRSGVNLGGTEQSVLSQIVTRTEYGQGSVEEGCGVNDRDKLSSAKDCEAVAYLTVRGALVGTIREERENVFVARFVDGTWMIIGD